MRAYSLAHLSDGDLLRDLAVHARKERTSTAEFIAHIAEVDARRLFLPAGYPSMYEYCVQELRLAEYAALKRIRAGRAARRVPAVLDALVEGRVHLSALALLARHLTRRNADELLAAATHRTKAEVELLIARRFPKRDMTSRVQAIAPAQAQPVAPSESDLLAPGPVQSGRESGASVGELSPGTVETAITADVPDGQLAPGPVAEPYPRVKPLSPQRFGVQFTIDQATHDDLRSVQALLGHQIPSGDLAQIFSRALKLLKRDLEKNKFAATDRPQANPRPATSKRTIPARVRRAVNERDQGQCTFVGDTGHRCGARKFLEFDHIEPVARDGQATIENLRLRCRAHNQYEAECTFGDGFMHQKREAARGAA